MKALTSMLTRLVRRASNGVQCPLCSSSINGWEGLCPTDCRMPACDIVTRGFTSSTTGPSALMMKSIPT